MKILRSDGKGFLYKHQFTTEIYITYLLQILSFLAVLGDLKHKIFSSTNHGGQQYFIIRSRNHMYNATSKLRMSKVDQENISLLIEK